MSSWLVYLGTDRKGAGVTGMIDPSADIRAWVQKKFRAGWQHLVVRRDGTVIGGIDRQPFDRPRIWWAE